MNAFFSLRRIAVVAALALLGLAWPVSAAQAGDFQVRGTFALSAAPGNHLEGTLSGRAKPGGKFTGTVSGIQNGTGGGKAVNVLDFGGGDTLTYAIAWERDDATGLLVGTYVITDGTGTLAEASGSGSLIVAPAGDGTGTFELAGTLSF